MHSSWVRKQAFEHYSDISETLNESLHLIQQNIYPSPSIAILEVYSFQYYLKLSEK